MSKFSREYEICQGIDYRVDHLWNETPGYVYERLNDVLVACYIYDGELCGLGLLFHRLADVKFAISFLTERGLTPRKLHEMPSSERDIIKRQILEGLQW